MVSAYQNPNEEKRVKQRSSEEWQGFHGKGRTCLWGLTGLSFKYTISGSYKQDPVLVINVGQGWFRAGSLFGLAM